MPALEFTKAPEVEEIAQERIQSVHRHLIGQRIGYVFRSECTKSKGCEIWATANKLGPREAYFAKCDLLIDVAEDIWYTLTPAQQVALIDHELCHFALGPKERIVLRGHDFEDFHEILARHGLWADHLKPLAGALEANVMMELGSMD